MLLTPCLPVYISLPKSKYSSACFSLLDTMAEVSKARTTLDKVKDYFNGKLSIEKLSEEAHKQLMGAAQTVQGRPPLCVLSLQCYTHRDYPMVLPFPQAYYNGRCSLFSEPPSQATETPAPPAPSTQETRAEQCAEPPSSLPLPRSTTLQPTLL